MDINNLVYKMLTTSTGKALMDSGGDDGRHWQRNQKKTKADFDNEPTVSIDDWDRKHASDSSELLPSVSLYHYMTSTLELDTLCDEFNALPCDNWDSDLAYGISPDQAEWLVDHGLKVSATWNSYNGESNLSQTIQGANLDTNSSNMEFPEYHLIQIHQGADIRGGYTDAKLFKVREDYFTSNPDLYGTIDDQDVGTSYDGITLTTEDGDAVPVTADSKIDIQVSSI